MQMKFLFKFFSENKNHNKVSYDSGAKDMLDILRKEEIREARIRALEITPEEYHQHFCSQ